MTRGMLLTRRDGALVGLGFLAGAVALPWLPGRYLPPSAVTAAALAFLLPATALSMCLGQSVFASRARLDDESAAASTWAVAAAPSAARLESAIADADDAHGGALRRAVSRQSRGDCFGLHVAAVGNVLPRLRPGWPAGTPVRESSRQAWMHVHRTVWSLCVAGGIAITVMGATLGGRQIDVLLKIGLVGAALCLAWSLRRLRMA